ncbi:M48 family metallopeptidase [Massilia yuzhufengensis]|uniref:Peptidase family M48 n=1 Tax=Massilia yuzhufengensis TaxID=1164594 RepID=A0A1I1HW87_9BURK|nr:M48 family metallopeptidase [Massilia yuzhufengensis]SFC27842.1 Peptidase family M48 [Massilia yuzhufengensis]
MNRIQRLRPYLRIRQAALGTAAAILLSACATQGTVQPGAQPGPQGPATEAPAPVTPEMTSAAETLTRMAALQERLYKVAAPLLIDNAELCTRHARNLLGFTAKNRHTYPGSYNEAAHAVLGMGERLQVTNVLVGSGAAKAGLRQGDELVAAAGTPLPPGPAALSQAGAIFGPIVKKQASLPLTIERKGRSRELTVPVTRACAFGIELGNADNVNAYADGQRVMVTRGMMGFVQDDDELAFVVAHTMAHNMLGHAASQRNAATIGGIIENLTNISPDTSMLIGSGGIKAMPATLDAAAERLAVYLLARAGYRVDNVGAFWKRFAATYPATVLNSHTASHPSLALRVASIDKAVAEVKARKSADKPLLP